MAPDASSSSGPYPRGDQLHPLADLHLKSLPADIKAVVYGTNHEFHIVSLEYQNSAELSMLTYEWRAGNLDYLAGVRYNMSAHPSHQHHKLITRFTVASYWKTVTSQVICVSSWRQPQGQTRSAASPSIQGPPPEQFPCSPAPLSSRTYGTRGMFAMFAIQSNI